MGGTMKESLKIAIADDEEMVCVVIQDSIDFDGIGLDLVGVAYDGLSLLNIITEKQPDIVITDISMPGMNGLDLIKEVQKRKIDCKYIIVSGYSQFEYARKAIQYKVDDYLLKPINKNELNEILIKLKKTILIEQKRLNIDSQVLEDHYKNKETIRRLFLSRIISGYYSPIDLDRLSNEYGILFSGTLFQGAVIKLDIIADTSGIESDFDSIQSKIIRIFNQILNPHCREILHYFENSILYLAVNYDQEYQKIVSNAFKNFFEHTKNITNLFAGMKITLGLGLCYSDVSELKKSLDEGVDAIYHRITMGVDRILFYSQLPQQLNNFNADEHRILFQRIKKNFESIDIEDYQRCILKIFSPITPNPVELFTLCFEIESLFFEVNNSLDNNNEIEHYQQFLIHQEILNSITIPQLKKHMLNSIKSIMTNQLDRIKKKNAKPVRDAIRFIKEHYHEPLDLERVAEAILFNPVYISNVFKKETGENFIDYVNKYRIDVAKEMLRTSNDKISSISNAVGINDSKYFSKLFRKYVGLKPSEYRNIYGG